ncbi:MAG: transglutaminase-like domain-containing protein [Pseudomonadota bacterium]
MKFTVGCDLGYHVPERCTFVFSVAAEHGGTQQVISEEWLARPPEAAEWFLMPDTGNRCLRLESGPGTLRLRYRATVDTAPSLVVPTDVYAARVGQLPPAVLPYLLPSRYCPSDQLLDFAGARFGYSEPGYPLAVAIRDWVSQSVTYLADTSTSVTTALDTLHAGAGVCRDFAHLGIALCRAVNLPARFVSAYACGLKPQDFHAMYEVWLGDRWYLFDPTGHARLPAVVRIGKGRDAADVAFANILGPAEMTEMEVFIQPDAAIRIPEVDSLAVSGADCAETLPAPVA